jgi:hypothetical protein
MGSTTLVWLSCHRGIPYFARCFLVALLKRLIASAHYRLRRPIEKQ